MGFLVGVKAEGFGWGKFEWGFLLGFLTKGLRGEFE